MTEDTNSNHNAGGNPAQTPAQPERIAKVMARAGVASRREAERMILEGRVTVNGQKIASPALDVLPTDRVAIDGKTMDEPQETRLWLYYKPLGLVTSEADEKGRQTVFDALPRDLPRVMTVGRLDLNSEGLLLLTNDGELKRRLELPSTGWLRRYRVRVNGTPNDLTFASLRRGVTIDGEEFAPMEIKLDSQQGANAWLTVGIREGKNREIRRAMAHVGLQVNRLIRVGYGPFKLGTMEKNEVTEIKRRVLRDQLGGLLTGEVEDKPREMRPRGAAGARDDGPAGGRRFGGRPGAAKPFPARPREDREPGRDAARGDDRGARGWGARPAQAEGAERPRFKGKPGGGRPDFGDRPRPAGDKPRWSSAEGGRGEGGRGEGGRGEGKPGQTRGGDAKSGEGKRPGRFAGKPGEARKPFGKPRDGDARPPRAGFGKPGPRAGGDDGARDGAREGARFAGKPEGRPGGKFTGKPGAKPFGKPGGRSGGKPEGKPGTRPSGKPGGRPAGPQGGRPAGKPRG